MTNDEFETIHPTVTVNISRVLSFVLGTHFGPADIQMERLSQADRLGGNTSRMTDF